MEKLPMCRLCLVENVRMYVVVNKNLQALYEKLTDVQFVTEDVRPMLACFFCYTKLNQCWRLQRKCLEAEKLFAQMLNEDCEIKPQVNQDQLEFSGYIISPTEQFSIYGDRQTESDVIKEELPDVCEGQYDGNQTESEHEYLDSYSDQKYLPPPLETQDIPPHHYESKNLPAQDFEPEGGQHSESDSEDDVTLMNFKIEVEEEQEVSKMKRKANDTNSTDSDNLFMTRRELFMIMKNSGHKKIQDKIDSLKKEIEKITECDGRFRTAISQTINRFKYDHKSRWEAAHRIEDRFCDKNKTWLDTSLAFPTLQRKRSILGRPAKPFEVSSNRMKQQKTSELRKSTPLPELVYATQVKLRASGQGAASKIFKDILSEPTKYSEAYK